MPFSVTFLARLTSISEPYALQYLPITSAVRPWWKAWALQLWGHCHARLSHHSPPHHKGHPISQDILEQETIQQCYSCRQPSGEWGIVRTCISLAKLRDNRLGNRMSPLGSPRFLSRSEYAG